jgi:hypothetical protein
MNEAANVRSVDAIRDFRQAVVKFRDQASQALASVDVEIQRTLDWLGHDQLKFWKEEIRRREDGVNEAKMDLHRCQLSKNAAGETPACSDQKVALAKAKKRLVEAEEKIEKVRQWLLIIEQEISEYKGPSQQLANTIDAILPKSISVLDRKLASLEAYLNTAAPAVEAPVASSSAESSVEDIRKRPMGAPPAATETPS